MSAVAESYDTREISQAIEDRLASIVATIEHPDKLRECAAHAVLAGGKRLRPRLFVTLARDLGAPLSSDIIAAGCAFELLHCASLVHDDLPALDNDDLRRGKPTCHRLFGEATAILAGDLLVSLAMEVVHKTALSDRIRAGLLGTMAAGFSGLCRGQQLDLLEDERARDLLQIYALKTGALFGAILKGAVIAASGSAALEKEAHDLGIELGIHFQILDDYLDLFGSDEERGRARSSDTDNERRTFFSQYKTRLEGTKELTVRTEAIREKLRALHNRAGKGIDLTPTGELIEAICGRISLT